MQALEQMLKDMAVTPPRADCDQALAGATSPEGAHKILNDKRVPHPCITLPQMHILLCYSASAVRPARGFLRRARLSSGTPGSAPAEWHLYTPAAGLAGPPVGKLARMHAGPAQVPGRANFRVVSWMPGRLVERADLRATGRVVAVLEPSPRRNQVVGVLQQAGPGCVLVPVDPRLPKGRVRVSHLPATLRAELQVRRSCRCTLSAADAGLAQRLRASEVRSETAFSI